MFIFGRGDSISYPDMPERTALYRAGSKSSVTSVYVCASHNSVYIVYKSLTKFTQQFPEKASHYPLSDNNVSNR